MKAIATTEYYSLAVDQAKNRLYLTINGFWKNRAAVSNYLADLKKATQELSTGYTVFTDVTQMKTPPQDVAALHIEAQKVVVSAGLRKTAELVAQNVAISMPLNRYAKTSGMQRRTFHEREEAEVWLDEQQAPQYQ